MYSVGLTEQDKDQADAVMLHNLVRLIDDAMGKPAWWRPDLIVLKRLRYARAMSYFLAVHQFGDRAFWAGKSRPTDTDRTRWTPTLC